MGLGVQERMACTWRGCTFAQSPDGRKQSLGYVEAGSRGPHRYSSEAPTSKLLGRLSKPWRLMFQQEPDNCVKEMNRVEVDDI